MNNWRNTMWVNLSGKSNLFLSTLCALGFTSLLVFLMQPVQAGVPGSILTVNSSHDTSDPGHCTLREAINNAKNDNTGFPDCTAGSGSDTIVFSSGLIAIVLISGLPFISEDLTIDGSHPAGANHILSGNEFYGIFQIDANKSLFRYNQATYNGGAIAQNNSSSLTVTHSVFWYNSALQNSGNGGSQIGKINNPSQECHKIGGYQPGYVEYLAFL
jgi:CSLREA domain-containing protein